MRALRAGGWEVVVAHRWGGPLTAWLDAHADRSVTPPLNRLRAALQTITSLRRAAGLLETASIRWVLRRVQPDLVWCNTVVTARWAAAAAARRVPVVLMSHEVDETWVRDRAGGLDVGAVVLAACSSEAADVLAAAVGVDRDVVAVLRPGVDLPSLLARTSPVERPRRSRQLVVACGVGDGRKGVDVFAQAAAIAAASGLDAEWRWVGRRPATLPPGPVTWFGEVDDGPGHIAAADVFTLPSRAEGFPLVALEAMALGRPIVASDLRGPREQLGDACVLVPAGDAAMLASAVADLLGDPHRARALGEAAAERCLQHWDQGAFAQAAGAVAERAVAPRPIRVLHLMNRLSRDGGIQVVVRRLATCLAPDRVELHVVTLRPRIEGDHTDDVRAVLHPLGYRRTGYRLRDRCRLSFAISREVRRIRPDVVHLHSGLAWLGYGAWLAAPGASTVLEVHDAPDSGRHSRLTDRVERFWMRKPLAALAVAHSESVAGAVEREWSVAPDRIVIVPLGVDTATFRPRAEEERRSWRRRHGIPADIVVAIGVGRFVTSKHFATLVAAAALLGDLGVVLVGGGPLSEPLREAARSHEVEHRLWLTGPLHDQDLADALGAADILCSPSEYEGFGLTLIEGMACALPVVARAVGGVPDLIEDGVTGRLIGSSEPAAWARVLGALATDPGERQNFGTAGRAQVVAAYGLAPFAEAFQRVYEYAARPTPLA